MLLTDEQVERQARAAMTGFPLEVERQTCLFTTTIKASENSRANIVLLLYCTLGKTLCRTPYRTNVTEDVKKTKRKIHAKSYHKPQNRDPMKNGENTPTEHTPIPLLCWLKNCPGSLLIPLRL